MQAIDLADVTADAAESWPRQGFSLASGGGGIPLALAEIRRSGENGRPGGAFSLTFLAPAGPFLPQAIYPVSHPELGTLEIFLVPIGPLDGGNGYEAMFG